MTELRQSAKYTYPLTLTANRDFGAIPPVRGIVQDEVDLGGFVMPFPPVIAIIGGGRRGALVFDVP